MRKEATGFAVLKVFSWDAGLSSDAKWFYGNKRNILKGNLYLTENWLRRNEIWWAVDKHKYCNCVTYMCKRNSNFYEVVIDKI